MKEDHESCSTGSSLSGIYKNFFKSQTQPVCMFYFSHPFGISTPSSTNNADVKKKQKKGSKYTTTTYLVTEIQKNHSDGSQDEADAKNTSGLNDKDLLPWPKNFLLPPLIQLIEKKHGKKLPDIDAILRQVRKQAWNTPKSHHSHSFWSRGSSISSDDFSSITSPELLIEKSFYTKKAKLKKKLKGSQNKVEKMSMNEKSNGSSGSGHGKSPTLLKRRYSVPEIIMRKYSLAQQKTYEESTSIYSTTAPTTETITKRNGQSNGTINNHNKKPIQPQTPSSHTASPIKYFIPLSPQQSSNVVSSPTLSNCSFGGSGGFFHNTSEISMRKQTLLRRMWSREFQHTKYSGSWSPPLRKSTHHNTQSRLKKFNTLPEFLSSSCEKCRELGVLSRDNFDDDSCENKEDKSQQTDFEYDVSEKLETQQQILSSASSSASTIIQSSDIVGIEANTTTKSNSVGSQTTSIKNSSSSSITDANGNNIIICMTTLQQEQQISPDSKGGGNEIEDMLQVEIDTNNNNSNNVMTTTAIVDMNKNGDKYLKKQFSTQLEDEGYHPQEELTNINYRRLREDKLNDTEIDQYISQMLIDNLNNVIKTVNENLQANGEHNLVKIDYNHHPTSGVVDDENVLFNTNNKLRNQHEIAIQMRNAKNGDNSKNRNSNDSMSPTNNAAVEHDICGNTDVNSPKLDLEQFQNNNLNHRHYFATSYVDSKSVSENSNTSTDLSDQLEITAVINTGTSYPLPNRPDSILVPRVIGPKTESMEVNPSSSSAQDDDELDGMPDSDDEDLISDVDSLDDVVTIRAKKLNELAQQQHRKAQALFRQTHLKGQAFFVPIVDTDQPIDEHIVVADTMPEKLKEKLVLRQRRRDMKKQSEMKMKQWKMQRFIERKMEHLNVVNDYLADLSTTGGAFKIIGMQSRQLPIETTVYKRASANQSGGWVPKQRTAPPQITTQQSNESTSEKSSKSKKLRNEIGMLESYKIDARGNMQIQAPKKEKEKPPKPKIKRTSYTSISDGKGSSSKGKLKTPTESIQRKSVPSSKRMSSNIPTSSASSVEAIDARRRQIMKDVQQMSVYKNDLTPDPDSGPSRKMWKTEIQEGDKHIEILEIVECVDGNTLAQQAPENNNFNHLFTSSPSNNSQNHHKFYHVPSSSSSIPHSMFVNKTFSVKTSGFDDTGAKHYASRIPVPVYRPIRHYRQPFINYEPRDTSPSNNFSSSTDAEESLTSAGSSVNQHASKVDRMIANLLMEALKSPDDIGMDYIKSPKVRRMKRRSQSPGGGAESSSTGYYTGDSSSRRSASNSAGKYQHRFEVIPEEKSSFSVDSSNDDFIEDEEEENTRNEKINNINNDWKSKKNLQNNDIKTRNITPQRQSQSEEDEEEDKENADGKEEEIEKCKTNKIPQPKKSPARAIVTPSNHVSNNNLKVPSSSIKSVKSSPAKSPSRSIKSNKSTTGADSSLSINASASNKKDMTLMDVKTPTKTTADTKDASETKSFVMFTDENGNDDDIENDVTDGYERNLNGNESSLEQHKPEVTTATSTATHENFCQSHFADKSCQLGITDISLSLNTPQSKDSEALKSMNLNNFTKFNIENPTNPNSSGSEFPSTLVNDMQNKLNYPSAGDNTPISSCNDTSRLQTADEKIIQIELSNENSQKPQTDRDNDTCSCTKKYLPYRINEKNVWQVYETSDCKYIHSKVEIDEVFQPPPTMSSNDSTTFASENCNLLHSRSNFSNQIVCHAINHEMNHSDNALNKMNETDSVNINSNNNNKNNNITQTSQKSFNTGTSLDNIYTPTFNIKPVNNNIDTCQCNIKDKYESKNRNIKYDEEDEVENASKANNEEDDDVEEDNDVTIADDDEESVIITNQSISTLTRETFAGRETGKLLNRPKATNNISRDQVKPVEKEIEKEITQNGMKSSSTNAFKTSSKPIRLPSPNLKQQQQQQRNNSYEDNSNESSASSDSQCESPKHIPKISSKQNSKESTPKRKSKTLMKQENKNVVIPNIHQGWSVTVAGTHPDLAPDVEMKISFPKPKGSSQTASIGPSEVSVTETQKSENEVFYYKNNQLLPPPQMNQSANPMQYDPIHNQPHPYEQSRPQMAYQYEQSHMKHPHYYNHRRSLSLARIDSGMSSGMVKPKSYNLPNLHVPRPTARNAFKQVTTISSSKTIIPSRRSLSLDVGNQNRRLSLDSRSQVSPITPSEMLSVVGSEIKKTLKPKVKTMSERDLTKRHLNCFTRNNGHMF